MKNANSFMTPISSFFMLIAIAPYVGMRFGRLPLLLMSPLILYSALSVYRYYTKIASEKKIPYTEALEEDLPNMSPMHFIFFMLIAAPLFYIITNGAFKGLIGIAILWIMYAIYYYGFRKRIIRRETNDTS